MKNFSHVLIVFGLIALAVLYTITSFATFTNDGFWWGLLSLIPFANVVMAFIEQIWLGVIWLACAAIFLFGMMSRPRYR
jgi:Ca2+/Na+ antiporter